MPLWSATCTQINAGTPFPGEETDHTKEKRAVHQTKVVSIWNEQDFRNNKSTTAVKENGKWKDLQEKSVQFSQLSDHQQWSGVSSVIISNGPVWSMGHSHHLPLVVGAAEDPCHQATAGTFAGGCLSETWPSWAPWWACLFLLWSSSAWSRSYNVTARWVSRCNLHFKYLTINSLPGLPSRSLRQSRPTTSSPPKSLQIWTSRWQ